MSASAPGNQPVALKILAGAAAAPIQFGRAVTWGALQARARAADRAARGRVSELGRLMLQHDVGDLGVLARLAATRKTLDSPLPPNELKRVTREYNEQLHNLASLALLGSEPQPKVEHAYQDARAALATVEEWRAKARAVAERLWPVDPLGWLALVASYALSLVVFLVLLAFFLPGWAPTAVVKLVNPSALPPAQTVSEMAGKIDSFDVKVKSVQIGTGLPSGAGLKGGVSLPQRCLVVVVEVTNPAGGRAGNYRTWRGAGGANVVDNRGNSCLQVVLNSVPGGVEQAPLPPGGTVEDVLLFAPPPAGFESIELFLPGANLESGATLRLRVPASAVTVQAG